MGCELQPLRWHAGKRHQLEVLSAAVTLCAARALHMLCAVPARQLQLLQLFGELWRRGGIGWRVCCSG